jgi:hypothetical protein
MRAVRTGEPVRRSRLKEDNNLQTADLQAVHARPPTLRQREAWPTRGRLAADPVGSRLNLHGKGFYPTSYSSILFPWKFVNVGDSRGYCVPKSCGCRGPSVEAIVVSGSPTSTTYLPVGPALLPMIPFLWERRWSSTVMPTSLVRKSGIVPGMGWDGWWVWSSIQIQGGLMRWIR